MPIKLVERIFFAEDESGWRTDEHKIFVGDTIVGVAYVMTSEEQNENYLEDIYIEKKHQGRGYGTFAIRELAKRYGYIYFAATDVNNKRLYERIAKVEPSHMDHEAIDQGFGIFFLEG